MKSFIKVFITAFIVGAVLGCVAAGGIKLLINHRAQGPRCNAELLNTGVHCTEPLGHAKHSPHINQDGYIWEDRCNATFMETGVHCTKQAGHKDNHMDPNDFMWIQEPLPDTVKNLRFAN